MLKCRTRGGNFLFVALLFFNAVSITVTPVASAQTAAVISDEGRRGIELYNQNKFADASDLLRKAVKKNAMDDQSWCYLGLALLHQPKEIKDASKALETAIKLQPNLTAAHVGLGYAYLLRNKTPEAVSEAHTALSIQPNSVDAHYILGVGRLRAGDKAKALEEAESAINLNRQFAAAYLLKSEALVTFLNVVALKNEESDNAPTTRYGQAADALEKYLQLNPNSTEKQALGEQLESLRFHSETKHSDRTSLQGVFSRGDLTTKARVLKKPEPAYTETARSNHVTGTVVLRGVFAADGTVKHLLVLQGLPDGLTEAAVRVARKIKFIPATIEGHPVSTFIQLEYNFNLY